MVHEPYAEWAALYAVGALDGDELMRFESHLAGGCKTCDAAVWDLSAVAAFTLPRTLPSVPLRPELRARLMRRLATEEPPGLGSSGEGRTGVRTPSGKGEPTRPGVRRRPWPWLTAAIAAGLAGFFAWNLHLTQASLSDQRGLIARLEAEESKLTADLSRRSLELDKERQLTALVSGKDTRVARLDGVEAAKRAEAWIVFSPEKKRGFFVVHFLPMLSSDKQYQLWVVADGQRRPAGVFSVDEVGHNALEVEVEASRPEGFEITEEPAGGVSAPSGPLMMKGEALERTVSHD